MIANSNKELPCGHTWGQHHRMEHAIREANALFGKDTLGLTTCQIIDMAEKNSMFEILRMPLSTLRT